MKDVTAIGILKTKEQRENRSGSRFGRKFFKSEKSVKLFSAFVAFFILALITVSVSQLQKLSTEYSIEQFFPARHVLLRQSAKIRRTFQLDERPSFLIVIETPHESWLTPDPMKRLSHLTKTIQGMKGVGSAMSLAALEGALTENQNLNIGPLYERLPASQWKSFTKSNELIRSQLISEDSHSTLLVVEPHQMSPANLNFLSARLQHVIQKQIPNAQVEIGGVPAIQGQLSERLYSELRIFLILSVVAFCSVFFLFFRGFSAMLLTLVSLILANVVVLGTISALKIPFSILLTTLPIVVSIALVSVNIHSLHRWAELVQPNSSLRKNFRLSLRVLKEMAMANFLGSLTTSIGFITLCTTDIPLIRQYGWVVASSVMVAWLLTHLVLLGFMHFTRPVLREWTHKKALWTLPILRHAKPVLVSIVVGCAVFAIVGRNISFSGRLFDDLPQQDSARRATEKIDQQFGGVGSYDFVLQASNEGFWKQPENLKLLQSSLMRLRHLPAVGSAVSLTDFFDGGKVPPTKEAVAEFLFLYSMSEANPLKNYVTDDGRTLRMALRFHDLPSDDITHAREKIWRVMHHQFPEISLRETGMSLSSHTINQQVAKDLVFNFWHSILLVGLLLMLVFRSLRWALIACLPNLVPPAILIGVLAITQTPVKPGVALIFSIALGLAFNNTVYLLSRMKRIMKEKNLSILPLKQALLQEGNPCLFESLVMFSGFVIFLSSGFKLNQTFGVYMVLSILAGTLGDLVFLPAVLKIFPGLLRARPAKTKKSRSIMSDFPISLEENRTAKVAASFLLAFFMVASIPQKAHAADNEAAKLLKQVQGHLEAKDDQATVKMKIIEANGETKARTLKLQTLRDSKFHALARIEAPSDIKGTGFLAEIDKDKEEQWIYLPSTKQVRRVVGTKKTTGVLGSELTIEDLNSTAIRSSAVKMVKKDAKLDIIEITPQAGTSLYNKVLISIDPQQLLPQQTEYFQGGKVKKTVRFSKYVKVGTLWRAQLIEVKNLANKRGTNLELSDLKVNSGLTSDDFSVNALKPD